MSPVSTRLGSITSFEPLEYGVDDLISQQFHTAFINIQFRKKGLSIVDHFPCLYKTPHPVHEDVIPFFLSYHQENIDYGWYFWPSDYHGFIKERLLELAKQSDALKYAVAAFSALVYSIQVNHHVKQYVFHFYAKTIQQLQQVINTDSVGSEVSLYTTVATILELASIEVCTYAPPQKF